MICLRTFSKIHGLAALRIGYGYSSPEMISLLQRARQPFNVNSVAQAAAIGALEDSAWVTQCKKRNRDGLEQLAQGLQALGIEHVPSHANFILSKPGDGRSLFLELQKQGIITRALGPLLSDYLRISVGTEEEKVGGIWSVVIISPHILNMLFQVQLGGGYFLPLFQRRFLNSRKEVGQGPG